MAAMLVTIAAGGDNLAVYIPLFRVGGIARIGIIVVVFAWARWRSPCSPSSAAATRGPATVMARFGVVAVPVLLCVIGVLVLLEAGTLSFL